MYHFDELQSRAAELLQRANDDDYKDFIGTWLNISLQSLYNKYDYFDELKNVHNFTTVDGTARYYTPSDFEKPFRFYDLTNDNPIAIRTHEEYFDANIANVADEIEGNATQAYFTEVVGVKVQVATTGETVQAKSSNAADTTQIVRVEGYLDSSLTIVGFENITLNGTTVATATSPNTFYKILRVSKSADTSGYVTLENSSGTDLSILGQIDRVARYKAFDLGLIPDDSVTSMRIIYKKRFQRLVNDYDYPFVDCDDYLIYNTVALGLQQDKETIDRATMMKQLAQEAMAGVLSNQDTILGPSFQHKMVSTTSQAHRS